MTYGLTFINPEGFVQIDNNFKTYRVYASGYVAKGNFANIPITINVGNSEPLIFVRPEAYGKTFGFPSSRGYDFHYKPNNSIRFRVRDSCYYVVVVPMNGSHSDTHGIKLYQSDGTTVVFDSGWSYVSIDVVALKTVLTQNSQVYTYSQTIALTPPPFGQRYFLLNNVGLVLSQYSYTETGNEPYYDYEWDVVLYGIFDSEYSVTYKMSEYITTGSGTGGGSGLTTRTPLVSAYINI